MLTHIEERHHTQVEIVGKLLLTRDEIQMLLETVASSSHPAASAYKWQLQQLLGFVDGTQRIANK